MPLNSLCNGVIADTVSKVRSIEELVDLAELFIGSDKICPVIGINLFRYSTTSDETSESGQETCCGKIGGEFNVNCLGHHAYEHTTVCLDERSILVLLLLDENRTEEIYARAKKCEGRIDTRVG